MVKERGAMFDHSHFFGFQKKLIAGSALVAISSTQSAFAVEDDLQTIFDNLVDTPTSTVTVPDDALDDINDSYWSIIGNMSSATIVLELAGNEDDNVFGLFDQADPTNQLTLFSGGASIGESASVSITSVMGGYEFSVGGDSAIFASEKFGYFLTGPGFINPTDPVQPVSPVTFFSDTSLNTDDSFDHMMAYQGEGESIMGGSMVWDEDTYALAWEDLLAQNHPEYENEPDFNDFVVLVKDVRPMAIPEPRTYLLLATTLGIAAALRRTPKRAPLRSSKK